MEEDKSKRNKRNKKKKNKQASKKTENVTIDSGESTSDSQNHIVERGDVMNAHVSGIIDERGDVGGHMDVVKANFLEKINELQAEKDARIQQQAFLNAELVQLKNEKDSLVQKESSLEQKIQQLLQELDARSQKEATLAGKILYLEAEKESWLKKEDAFEEKINQLVEEAEVLNLKLVGLQEMIKDMEQERDSWILKENLSKESIANLTNDNTQLQAQVMELEQARETLLEEKKQLEELLFTPKLPIKNLENTTMDNKAPCEEDMKYQIESAARAISDKLTTEKVKDGRGDISSGDRRGVPSGTGIEDGVMVRRNAYNISEGDGVALIEAPLIGAPFRFISFVARYVSGADLLE